MREVEEDRMHGRDGEHDPWGFGQTDGAQLRTATRVPDDVQDALDDLGAGRTRGRAIPVP